MVRSDRRPAPACVAAKLQLACFERLGAPDGPRWSARWSAAREAGLLVIADGKRGRRPGQRGGVRGGAARRREPWGESPASEPTRRPSTRCSAPTRSSRSSTPRPTRGAGLFVLVRTSNPGARRPARPATPAARRCYERLAELVADRWRRACAGESGLSGRGRGRRRDRARAPRAAARADARTRSSSCPASAPRAATPSELGAAFAEQPGVGDRHGLALDRGRRRPARRPPEALRERGLGRRLPRGAEPARPPVSREYHRRESRDFGHSMATSADRDPGSGAPQHHGAGPGAAGAGRVRPGAVPARLRDAFRRTTTTDEPRGRSGVREQRDRARAEGRDLHGAPGDTFSGIAARAGSPAGEARAAQPGPRRRDAERGPADQAPADAGSGPRALLCAALRCLAAPAARRLRSRRPTCRRAAGCWSTRRRATCSRSATPDRRLSRSRARRS